MNSDEEKLIIADPDEIRPRRPIPKHEIDEVIRWHLELGRSMLDRAIEIGFKLRCWHGLIPHGRWLEWTRNNLPQMSERSIQVYLKLWDNNKVIRARLPQIRSSATDLTLEPSIREALALITSKRTPTPPKKKQALRRNHPPSIETDSTILPPSANAPDPVRPEKIDTDEPDSPEPPRCPLCGQLLPEEAKVTTE